MNKCKGKKNISVAAFLKIKLMPAGGWLLHSDRMPTSFGANGYFISFG